MTTNDPHYERCSYLAERLGVFPRWYRLSYAATTVYVTWLYNHTLYDHAGCGHACESLIDEIVNYCDELPLPVEMARIQTRILKREQRARQQTEAKARKGTEQPLQEIQ